MAHKGPMNGKLSRSTYMWQTVSSFSGLSEHRMGMICKKKNPKEKVSVARHGVVPLKMANLICISNHPMLLILREEGEVFKR